MERVGIAPNLTEYAFPDQAAEEVEAVFAVARYGASRKLMGAAATIAYLENALSRYRSRETLNIVTEVGIFGLAYNCSAAGNADGDVLATFKVGDDDTLPDRSDTALGNILATFEDPWQAVVENMHIMGYVLAGPKRDSLIGETIKEVGVHTAASGSGKDSDNVLFARAVLYTPDQHTIAASTSYAYVWTFAYQWGGERPVPSSDDYGYAGLDFGLHYFATRMYDLSLYDEIGYIAVGTGAGARDTPWIDELESESGRVAVTFTASNGTVTGSATISQGAIGSFFSEIGPAVGSGSAQVLHVSTNFFGFFFVDNDNFDIDVESSITFYNAHGPLGYATQRTASTTTVTVTATGTYAGGNGLLGLRDGDVLVAFVEVNVAGATLTAPGGWSLGSEIHDEIATLTHAVFLYYQADNNPAASYIFTSTSSGTMRATLVAFRRIATVGSVPSVFSDYEEGTDDAMSCPSVELPNPGVDIRFVAQRGSHAFTGASSYYNLLSDNVDPSFSLWWKPVPLGSTGAVAITSDGSAGHAATTLALERESLDGNDPKYGAPR